MLKWVFVATLAVTQCLASVSYYPAANRWALETANTSYLLGVNSDGRLECLYWGMKLGEGDYRSGVFREQDEYPAWGGGLTTEPALKATFPDGVRDLSLKYLSHNLTDDLLTITLKDIGYDLLVDLEYRVFPSRDILAKRAVIRNQTGKPVVLESAQSAVWNLPEGTDYRMTYLVGRWGNETQVTQEELRQGRKIIESRIGKTSHMANPWFAMDAGDADETDGRVWFGALGWSGNWSFVAEKDEGGRVRLVGGYNPFDFDYCLAAGETLDTPLFYGGFTSSGFGEASRILHRFIRGEILPVSSRTQLLPVMYNHWYSTTFDVSEASLTPVAEQAAKLGIEIFVMDDGWFGARNDDRAGLGDWFPNPQKFPQGLGPLIRRVNDLGMKFGIWVEPEMVNPDSDLFRAHPDWIINFPGRPKTQMRNQYNLNLARTEVREYLFGVLDKLLSENHIEYVKWDMNRHFSEPGWPEAGPDNQRRLYVEYVRNLYDLFDRLRAKHPRVIWETCSGGGGRIDLGILKRAEQAWTSDNTDPFDRLRIQEGFTYAYPPKIMMSWVTDSPDSMNRRSTSLDYRFLVSMMGSLGISVNFNQGWTPDDLVRSRELISYYKSIRPSVQEGDLYRLASPRTGDLTALNYVSPASGQVVVFAFRHSQQFRKEAPPVRLQGLEEAARYRVSGQANDRLLGSQKEFSGAYLMEQGLRFGLRGDFDAASVTLDRVP